MKRAELVGQRFGRLTVSAFGGLDRGKRSQWRCVCDCGGLVTAAIDRLKSGNTRSCGCLQKEVAIRNISKTKKKQTPWPEVAFGGLFRRYKKDAQKRGLSFELTREQFRELTQQPCHYCGRYLAGIFRARGGQWYAYNGVDRVDSLGGYFPVNCVACCKTCNVAKSNLSVSTFLEHCLSVVKYRKLL